MRRLTCVFVLVVVSALAGAVLLTGAASAEAREYGITDLGTLPGGGHASPGYGVNSAVASVGTETNSIDSLIQQGDKLTGGGEAGAGNFGFSVALSADGSTALVGGPRDNGDVGAVWVFTRTGSTWAQQGDKLTGGGAAGRGWFGVSVALSSDGNTALVGGYNDNGEVGAAWVFTRSGSTWAQQGDKLTGGGEVGAGSFGSSVALAGDGGTALVGGPRDNNGVGAAWVFTRSGSTWAQQGGS